jgi:hypothetical protein
VPLGLNPHSCQLAYTLCKSGTKTICIVEAGAEKQKPAERHMGPSLCIAHSVHSGSLLLIDIPGSIACKLYWSPMNLYTDLQAGQILLGMRTVINIVGAISLCQLVEIALQLRVYALYRCNKKDCLFPLFSAPGKLWSRVLTDSTRSWYST